MASQRQLEANRTNALQSTGPKTASGLQVVSQNAVRHGVYSAKAILLPGEDEEAYLMLRDQLCEDFQATSQVEKLLVEKMVQSVWKKQRLAILEQQLLTVQQKEQAFNSQLKRKAFEAESATQKLEAEIKALQEEQESIQECLSTCRKYNRMRSGSKRDEEGKGLQRYLTETLKDARERLISFMDSLTLSEARQAHPKFSEAAYARGLVVYSVTSDIDMKAGDETPHPVYTYGLERFLELIEERKTELVTRLGFKQQKLSLMESLASVGLDLLPNEENLAKIQRYEAYLDGQFYKALQELQKLQVFLVQKKKVFDA